jgi:hypothetical protein
VTALAATLVPATATKPPGIRLDVTAAPNPPANAYSSNFSTINSWVAGTATISTDTSYSPIALYIRKDYPAVANTAYDATRVVSGLVVGVTYKYRAAIRRRDSGQIRLSVVGSTTGSWVSSTARTYTEISFTATATSHTIKLEVMWPGNPLGGNPGYLVDTVTVTPTSWQGTTITRQDANGYVVVREDAGGQDTSGGTMTVYDYEAALFGSVVYTVTDGVGSTATVTTSHAVPVTNYITHPSAEQAAAGTSGWSASRGTIDRVANTDAVAGGWVFRYTRDATVGTAFVGSVPTNGTSIPGIAAGQVWTFSAWVKLPVAGPVYLQIGFFDEAGEIAGSRVGGDTVNLSADVYGRPFVTATVPAGTTRLRAYLNFPGMGPNDTARYDAVMLTQGALRDAFSGDTVDPTGVLTYRWQGSAGGSFSDLLDPRTAPGPWLSTPAWDTVPSILNYDETEERGGQLRRVINRRDPVGNAGVMGYRTGTLDMWFANYADARAARAVLERGQTVLLRQPDFPGLDLWFVPGTVKLAPASLDTATIRWQLTVTYDEVAAP